MSWNSDVASLRFPTPRNVRIISRKEKKYWIFVRSYCPLVRLLKKFLVHHQCPSTSWETYDDTIALEGKSMKKQTRYVEMKMYFWRENDAVEGCIKKLIIAVYTLQVWTMNIGHTLNYTYEMRSCDHTQSWKTSMSSLTKIKLSKWEWKRKVGDHPFLLLSCLWYDFRSWTHIRSSNLNVLNLWTFSCYFV